MGDGARLDWRINAQESLGIWLYGCAGENIVDKDINGARCW